MSSKFNDTDLKIADPNGNDVGVNDNAVQAAHRRLMQEERRKRGLVARKLRKSVVPNCTYYFNESLSRLFLIFSTNSALCNTFLPDR